MWVYPIVLGVANTVLSPERIETIMRKMAGRIFLIHRKPDCVRFSLIFKSGETFPENEGLLRCKNLNSFYNLFGLASKIHGNTLGKAPHPKRLRSFFYHLMMTLPWVNPLPKATKTTVAFFILPTSGFQSMQWVWMRRWYCRTFEYCCRLCHPKVGTCAEWTGEIRKLAWWGINRSMSSTKAHWLASLRWWLRKNAPRHFGKTNWPFM